MELPKTMKAWQFGKVTNGIENSLKCNASVPVPVPKKDQHLVKVSFVSLNPADHKIGENAVTRRLFVPNPATPGIDFSGIIVKPAQGSTLKPGDKVFGCGGTVYEGGCLAEYAVAGDNAVIAVPNGLSLEHASTVGVAGWTAYQTIVPFKPKELFINGGSGGCGVFGIQIAKAIGSNVTVTCSQRNVELCTSLGADKVVDYTKGNLTDALAGNRFDHMVDNVVSDPKVYFKAQNYSVPGAHYVLVAGVLSLKYMYQTTMMKFWPGLLGGGKRPIQGFFAKPDTTQLEQIAQWMVEGKIKPVVDERFAFENAPQAYRKLKTNRARGKIVVEVGGSATT